MVSLACSVLVLSACGDDGSGSDEIGESDTQGETETETGTDSESGTDTGTGTETGTDSETDTEGETDTESETDTGTGGDPPEGDPCAPTEWDEADFVDVYDVGPGQPYEDPSAVPWESVGPGTLVRIHWRDEPYRDKWVINSVGTEDAPIVVTGVPEGGQLPVISGDGAKTRAELDYWNEQRGLIKIGGASAPSGDAAAWIHIENLDLREAHEDHGFTDANGNPQTYAGNAAALYVEWGSELTFRGNEVSWSGNGIFTGSQSADVHVECNYVHDNGTSGSIYEHNSYTESARITFEFNHYGPPCPSCPGNNLKDRSAGTVVRYNWIEAGNRQLDLVESDHQELVDMPEYATTQVYGNVLVEPDGAGNSQIIHYGGDLGDESYYRKGTLYLHHNTIVSTRQGNTTWMRLSSNGESCEARNNVVYTTAGPGALAISDGSGAVEMTSNYLMEGWVPTHGQLEGSVDDMGNTLGSDPGFEDVDGQLFTPDEGSPLVDGGEALPGGAVAPTWEYVPHQAGTPREDEGAPDVGAFSG